MKYYPNKTPAEIRLDADVLEKAKAFKSKAHWTGHGGQARMMALEEDPLEEHPGGQSQKSEFDYDALYFWTRTYFKTGYNALNERCLV